MDIHTYAGLVLLAALLLGLALIIHGTIVKNRWGGHTGPSCACELDKWGRPIARPV